MSPAARKRTRLALCLIVIIMSVALDSMLSEPKLYRGKTVGEWVSLLDMNVDRRQQRAEASAALTYIGAPAVPELERILAWRPSYLERVRNWAVRFGLAKPRGI